MKQVIFHIISSFDLGGAERVAINLAKSTSPNFEYHIVEVYKSTSNYRNYLLKELQNNHITYHESHISNKKIAILLFPFIFLRTYLKYKPNIIHTHTEIPDLSVYLFTKLFRHFFIKYKLYRTIHNTQLWNEWEFIGQKVEKLFIKEKSNIAISESVRMQYYHKYGSENIPLVYNGVEEKKQISFPFLKKDYINILFAGRLCYQKGTKQLIEIIKKQPEHLFFHIIGDGPDKEYITKELSGLQNYQIYNKWYNLSSYLQSFDYLFMPSNFEGLGLLSIEASLANTVVIINNTIGLNESLPSNWPLKVENNNTNKYISMLQNLPNKEEYKKLSAEAYEFVKKRFSINKMQREVEKIYNKSLNE